jgi:hypothetical protein
MGTTATSLHVLVPGTGVAALVPEVERAYKKLGFAIARKGNVPPARRVLLAGRDADRYLSMYDSDNDQLDSGDLKDLAVLLSKRLQSAVILTSVYDSDRFEFIVFHKGKQKDAAVSDPDGHTGGLRMLSGKQRAKEWIAMFGRAPDMAAPPGVVFAEAELARWCEWAGIPARRATAIVADFDDGGEIEHRTLAFGERKAPPAPTRQAASGQIFELFRDEDHDAAQRLFPAALPVGAGSAAMSWYALTSGPGFTGLRLRPRIESSAGARIAAAWAGATPIFNGQLTGGITPARHDWTELTGLLVGDAPEVLEAPGFRVPGVDPQTRRMFLIIVCIAVDLPDGGWVTATPFMEAASQAAASIELPPVRLATCTPVWIPRGPSVEARVWNDCALWIAGWARSAGVAQEQMRELIADALAHEPYRPWKGPSDNPTTVAQHIATARHTDEERMARLRRLLNAPAVALSVAILPANGEPERAQARSLLERWLDGIHGEPGSTATVRAEKHESVSFSVSKTHWTVPFASLTADARWRDLFGTQRDYRTVRIELTPAGHDYPQAGALFQSSGRRTAAPTNSGEVLNCSLWQIEHPAVEARFGTTGAVQTAVFANWLATSDALQAWSSRAAWIPDLGGYRTDASVHGTPYEQLALQRGIVDRQTFNTRAWAERRLRFMAPRLWFGAALQSLLDRTAVERVATVRQHGRLIEVALKESAALGDLESALTPILPALPEASSGDASRA